MKTADMTAETPRNPGGRDAACAVGPVHVVSTGATKNGASVLTGERMAEWEGPEWFADQIEARANKRSRVLNNIMLRTCRACQERKASSRKKSLP